MTVAKKAGQNFPQSFLDILLILYDIPTLRLSGNEN